MLFYSFSDNILETRGSACVVFKRKIKSSCFTGSCWTTANAGLVSFKTDVGSLTFFDLVSIAGL